MASVLLVERWAASAPLPASWQQQLLLSLSAEQRTRLRGHHLSDCGRDLQLQLPRGAPLLPGERLLDAERRLVVTVQAAPERLLRVAGAAPLALLQAAYHLGNRHVALELHSDHLLLQHDSVLLAMLERRGLEVVAVEAAFLPESGAYGDHAHDHHEHGP